MAKGKTNQPLVIVVWSGWCDHPAIREMEAYGHHVAVYPASTGTPPDLILHPAAGWHESLFEQFTRENGTTYRPYTEAAVKAARARKKVMR